MPDLYKKVKKIALEIEPCIHGARLIENAKAMGKNPDEMLDFSVNLNPLGPPELKQMLADAYENITFYPDNRYLEFRKAASEYLGILPENIVPGNGSSELIRLFAETVIEPGDKVIIPFPTFGEYEFQCRLFGADIEHINYKAIADIEKRDSKAVFLCNPNNPTGNLVKREKVIELARKCESAGTFLFVDEAFIELCDPKESVADFAASSDFVFVLRSLTKTYAIPGIRIGFGVTSPDFANILNKVRLHWNLNSIAAEVGRKLLKNNRNYIKKSLGLIKKEREWLVSKLSAIHGFKPYPSDANFILIDLNDFPMNSRETEERMLGKGVLIRDCTSFGIENHIRVAVRKRSENLKLIRAFSMVVSEWGSDLAKKEIGGVLEKGVVARSRVSCEYYPCHFEGQDCTFCFCPFYPCENERTGGELVRRSTGGKVWSCAGCFLIHRGETADKVLRALMGGKKLKQAWELVIEPDIR